MNSSTTVQNEMPKSRRRNPRIPRDGQVVISCSDRNGRQRRFRARTVDISKTGILLQTEEPVPQGTVVYLQTANFIMLGKASVRHCTQKGLKFRIGLYLPDPLTREI